MSMPLTAREEGEVVATHPLSSIVSPSRTIDYGQWKKGGNYKSLSLIAREGELFTIGYRPSLHRRSWVRKKKGQSYTLAVGHRGQGATSSLTVSEEGEGANHIPLSSLLLPMGSPRVVNHKWGIRGGNPCTLTINYRGGRKGAHTFVIIVLCKGRKQGVQR